jgi:hypothetical protein
MLAKPDGSGASLAKEAHPSGAFALNARPVRHEPKPRGEAGAFPVSLDAEA